MSTAENRAKADLHIFQLEEEFFSNYSSFYTRQSYRNDITQFFQFLEENYASVKSPQQIERVHVIEFRNFLQETGGVAAEAAAPKTVARKLASISSYFDYLTEKGQMKFNPASSVKRPRREVKTPTNALSAVQVREFLSAINTDTAAGVMHKALLLLFFTTGLRKSEVLNLRRKDFKEMTGFKIIEYRGKGGKLGQKLLHPKCVEALEQYLSFMKSSGREHAPQDWLFQPSRNPKDPQNLNKKINPRTVNEIIDHYAKKTGMISKLCPHSARATFITELLDAGVDIYKVAQEVNHASVNTTQEYDKRRKQLADSPVLKLRYYDDEKEEKK